LSLGDRKVAVAVNRDVVPRSRYDEFELNSGDRVEILEAVGGG
jgi:thiamine biosynthesis protein ThiS